ncbi:sugar phosphate isomerase/epimerase [Pelagicoccus sp. SDUM812002]|uniref:sugar phosphate isomerase/epimerase family protein n=1 Tax=Pelagicoccus sp. SDUM812002 TaxID=3041266 RepID=UPI00280E7061|nr:sugar phosphate isomerase/epimerase [Pelagicoccus sp. SDUM812002]MDQ8184206.1 sugar phosphate isomerase/epimerase [Pelagicoccus sp. SDUM812002]
MKFGASTWLWTSPFDGSDLSILKQIAELGFSFVEIPVEDPTAIDRFAIKAAMVEYGLETIVCTAVDEERDFSSPEPSVVETAQRYFEDCIELAKLWSSPLVVGPLYAPVGKARLSTEGERQLEWERSVANLRRLAATAGEAGVKLGIEPLNRFETDMINTVEDAMKMVEDVASPHLGVSLDSFHMSIEEVDFREAIRQAGDSLVHLQVSDSHRGVPGDGNSDWDGLRAGLQDIGYTGKISIESFSPDSSSLAEAVCIWKRFTPTQDEFAARGLQFLKSWYASVR